MKQYLKKFLSFFGIAAYALGAIGGFGKVVKGGTSDPAELIQSLGGVTGGLSIAFETTLIALVFALAIQLMMTFVNHKEEQFLDECSDYCHRNIISKIKSASLVEED